MRVEASVTNRNAEPDRDFHFAGEARWVIIICKVDSIFEST
jgi:hypothetical protein